MLLVKCAIMRPAALLPLLAVIGSDALRFGGRSVALPMRGAAFRRSAPLSVALGDHNGGGARPPYALSGLERPVYRGAVMGALHNTRAWYALVAAYVVAAASRLPRPMTAAPRLAVGIRVALALASSASVYISDGYHNADVRRGGVSEEGELGWLRLDYCGISAILATNFWLWASNFGFRSGLGVLSAYTGAALATVVAASFAVVPRYAGHVAVKLTLATQFVGFLGYLVSVALSSPSAACTLVYAAYVPGFILYATKFPKNPTFGYHEYFHTSVVIGNLASMGFDLASLGVF